VRTSTPLASSTPTIAPGIGYGGLLANGDFEVIREGKPAKITGVDGLRAQEFVQGAYQSMRTGGWVDLPLADDVPFVLPTYR
jgi:hypothetical protein